MHRVLPELFLGPLAAGRIRAAGQLVPRGVEAALSVRKRGRRPVTEKVVQEIQRVGDLDGPVVVGVQAVEAGRRRAFSKKVEQDGDGIASRASAR